MAKGGKQPGAGRPKGSKTRPQIRDYFTDKEISALITSIKKRAKKDPRLAQWLGDQLFGKAVQPIGGDSDGSPIVVKIIKYGDKKD